jgi:hypothetical protein
MPTCRECEITQATVEMRRAKAGTWLCKDKDACKVRRAARRANQIALKKGEGR